MFVFIFQFWYHANNGEAVPQGYYENQNRRLSIRVYSSTRLLQHPAPGKEKRSLNGRNVPQTRLIDLFLKKCNNLIFVTIKFHE